MLRRPTPSGCETVVHEDAVRVDRRSHLFLALRRKARVRLGILSLRAPNDSVTLRMVDEVACECLRHRVVAVRPR